MDGGAHAPVSNAGTPGTSGPLVQSPRAIPLSASSALPARISRETVFFDDSAVDQMLLNDALQHRRGAGVVPSTFGINDGDWPVRADTEAIYLAAVNQRLRSDE